LLPEAFQLTDKQFAVLRAMSTIMHSTEMDDFLTMVGLTSAELVETLKGLALDGFVTKTGKGYAIAEKGKLALTVFTTLPKEKSFHFYSTIGQPLGVSATNIKEFYEIIRTIPSGSIEFHMKREDFENWVQTAVKDNIFARELAVLRKEELKGEALRQAIVAALVGRFSEDVLFREWTA